MKIAWFFRLAGLAALFALVGCNGGGGAPASGRIALIAGASGETISPNFFIEDFRGFRQALVARGWDVRVVAGSKDGELQGSLRDSNESIARALNEALDRARSGQEVLVVFHSHGREQETYWGQRSHSIVSEDRDPSGNDPGFDLDSIEPALVRAKARGVRIGLIDLSCYSGSTQALQGTACTVSLAAARYVSLCSGRKEERLFNYRFFQLPPPGQAISLEGQFLEARRFDLGSINLPQISSRPTPARKGWEEFLVSADPLDTFEDLKDLRAGTPLFDPQALLREIDQWAAAQPGGKAGMGARPEFRALRAEVARQLGELSRLRRALEAEMPLLARDYDQPTLAVQLASRTPLKLGVAYLSDLLGAAHDGKIPDGYTDVQRGLVKSIEPLQSRLGAQYSAQLAAFQARRAHFDDLTDEYARAADKLFESERKLYELQPEPSGSNPCREFEL